jgi:heterodisulfide reductase subunit A-like polyferredoxin
MRRSKRSIKQKRAFSFDDIVSARPVAPASHAKTVVIIGGGVAGLSAAKALSKLVPDG